MKNVIVRNKYGEDPTKLDFDRVILHQQNLPGGMFAQAAGQGGVGKPARPKRPRPDSFNIDDFSQAFVYHDLAAEAATGVVAPRGALSSQAQPATTMSKSNHPAGPLTPRPMKSFGNQSACRLLS